MSWTIEPVTLRVRVVGLYKGHYEDSVPELTANPGKFGLTKAGSLVLKKSMYRTGQGRIEPGKIALCFIVC